MTPAEVAQILSLIAERAPALIAAGVRGTVTIGAVSFALAEPAGAAPVTTGSSDEHPDDALRDPATHGLFGEDAPARMPRRRREPLITEAG